MNGDLLLEAMMLAFGEASSGPEGLGLRLSPVTMRHVKLMQQLSELSTSEELVKTCSVEATCKLMHDKYPEHVDELNKHPTNSVEAAQKFKETVSDEEIARIVKLSAPALRDLCYRFQALGCILYGFLAGNLDLTFVDDDPEKAELHPLTLKTPTIETIAKRNAYIHGLQVMMEKFDPFTPSKVKLVLPEETAAVEKNSEEPVKEEVAAS